MKNWTPYILPCNVTYNKDQVNFLSKLIHPTLGERQKKSSLLPQAFFYIKGATFTFYFSHKVKIFYS